MVRSVSGKEHVGAKQSVKSHAGESFPSECFLGDIVIENFEAESWKADLNFETVVPISVYDKVSIKRNLKLQSTNKILLGPCKYRPKCLGQFSLRKQFYSRGNLCCQKFEQTIVRQISMRIVKFTQ